MGEDSLLSSRKLDHIKINLEEDVRSGIESGFDQYQLAHQALPDLDFSKIDTSLSFLGKRLQAPILISSMTGGTEEAHRINQVLAQAAQSEGIAMGMGSQRAGIEHPEMAYTFQVRNVAPDILLFANIGAVQLNYGYTIDHCRKAVDMIAADALILHLNPLQEAIQPEGDTNFAGLYRKIEQVCARVGVPVIAKEVGWGISRQTARKLVDAGVSAIDVAGAGGTSWSQVEKFRITDPGRANIAAAFRSWGIPTAESISQVAHASPGLPIIASGGIKSGIDIAKSIALWADLCGLAGPFLKAAVKSYEELIVSIRSLRQELLICMFVTNSKDVISLKKARIIKR